MFYLCTLCLHRCAVNTQDLQEPIQYEGASGAAAHCLKLPRKNLYLTPLLKAKTFTNFGYRTEAISVFRELQTAQLGQLKELGTGKGTSTVSCVK